MKIAILGTRGIPVIYSGFETFAQELSQGLVSKGHDLTVYCRKGYVNENKKTFKKVNLVVLPAPRSKNWETFFHSFTSTLHATFRADFDVIYYTGVGSVIFSFFPRLFGIKTVVNVDGLDWKREKWSLMGKAYLALSEYLATFLPNKVITDSSYIESYYKRKFKKQTTLIPYGHEFKLRETKIPKKYNLSKGKYIVWVGRLVPDNHPDELVKAFLETKKDIKCILLGDDLTDTKYKEVLKNVSSKDKRIIFAGFVKRELVASLIKNSLCYVETKRSGGTHPSLLEAMGMGASIISNDHPANKEVLNGAAVFYKKGSIDGLQKALKKVYLSRALRYRLSKKAKVQANKKYSWKKVIDLYDKFFKGL